MSNGVNMSIIKTVEEIRKKLNIRLDADDGGWKTIKGTHVLVDPDGDITKGPERLRNLPKKSSPYKKALESGSTLEVKNAIKSSLSSMPNGYTVVSHDRAYKKIGDDQFEYETSSGEKKTATSRDILRAHNKNDKDGDFEIKDDKYVHERKQVKSDLTEKLRPNRDDYEYEDGDGRDEFIHKNVGKLQALYDEGGSEAIDSEFYKFRLNQSTKDIHEVSKEDADATVYDNVRQSMYDGWFRAADSSYKPYLVSRMVSSPEMRNAGLSLAYENYKNNTKDPLPFEEFLYTPIKMYRGGHGQNHTEDDVFSAYTFDRKTAERFAGQSDDATVTEAEIRPIDTYGSMRAVGEAEIWVPREIAPNGRKDENDVLA